MYEWNGKILGVFMIFQERFGFLGIFRNFARDGHLWQNLQAFRFPFLEKPISFLLSSFLNSIQLWFSACLYSSKFLDHGSFMKNDQDKISVPLIQNKYGLGKYFFALLRWVSQFSILDFCPWFVLCSGSVIVFRFRATLIFSMRASECLCQISYFYHNL